MVGNFVNHDKGKDNDEWAIKNNYVSIVPCKFDLSSKRGLNYLNENWSI
jgi:5'-nucleotidase